MVGFTSDHESSSANSKAFVEQQTGNSFTAVHGGSQQAATSERGTSAVPPLQGLGTGTSSSSSSAGSIDKAVQFWTHPSLQNVSSDEKLQYLRHRIGLNEDDIHGVWDRILQGDTFTSPSAATPSSAPIQNVVPPPMYGSAGSAGAAGAAVGYEMTPHNRFSNHVVSPAYHPPWPPTSPYHHHPPPPPPPIGTSPFYREDRNHNQEIERGPAAMVPVWLTLGGLLGVTAAAVVRWLNGGDFCLFPPPHVASDDTTLPAETHGENDILSRDLLHVDSKERKVRLKEDVGSAETDCEHDVVATRLLSKQHSGPSSSVELKLDSLTQTLESHVRFQERLLQNLASVATDQSMNLLLSKNRNDATNHEANVATTLVIYSKLVEIKSELTNLHSSVSSLSSSNSTLQANDDLMDRLTESLDRLDACVVEITSSSETNRSATPSKMPSSGNISIEVKSSEANLLEEHIPSTTANVDKNANNEDMPRSHQLPSLREAIQVLAENNEGAALRVGSQLLYLYVIHLLSNPHVPRYRKIFTTTDSFGKVQQLRGGTNVLRAVGFVERDKFWEWVCDEADIPNLKDILTGRLSEAAAALSILKTDSGPPEQVASAALAVLKAETNSNSVHENDKDDEDVTSSLLLPPPSTPMASISLRSGASSTTPPTEARSRNVESGFLFQTPQATNNNIVSPPMTKKHPFFPPDEFSVETTTLTTSSTTADIISNQSTTGSSELSNHDLVNGESSG